VAGVTLEGITLSGGHVVLANTPFEGICFMILLSINVQNIFRIERDFILILVYISCNFDFFEFHEFKHEIQIFYFEFSHIIYHF